ncbi:MAG: glycosyltransferase [Candidatus Hydrogenedentota bacterium]
MSKAEPNTTCKISVVVATYNRAPLLIEMLDSFYAQDFPPVDFELLLVNNNANDNTPAVAQRYTDNPGFHYLFEPVQGLSPARNRAIGESRGEIIAFLDDDVIVDRHWMRHLLACYAQTGADAVGGRSYLIIRGTPPPWFGPDFRGYLSEVNLGNHRCDAGDGRRLFGLNVSFRRSALDITGLFDPDLGRSGGALLCGEERQILARIHAAGGKLFYEPEAVVGHIVQADRLNLAYFQRLCDGAGRSRARIESPAAGWTALQRRFEAALKAALYTILLFAARPLGRNHYLYRAMQCRRTRIAALREERSS